MLQFYRCLLSEFKKRKRGPFLFLHLGIPFLLPVVLIMYFLSRNTPVSAEAGYVVFFELVGVGTPAIISVICGIVADAENEAGHFQNMLGAVRSKSVAFISQTTMMVLSYYAALFLSISIYTLALRYLMGMHGINFTQYQLTAIIFTLASIFQYFFYLIIGYKYGMGICGIFGFGGVIIAALCLTTLGDKVWEFLPWSWANRLSGYFEGDLKIRGGDFLWASGGYGVLFLTIGIVILSIIWINRWSGRRSSD
ncbi:lantibiotic immunity ABC transporter MutG family permease subunit [Paenibacillus zanthoxyli]|uniref:lantibiotic immunity ABC transporter MutG family permease subunit n=1 Tax=Paenibacillus zanthoxyli TaxID=369399 RepID=UPI0004725A91|nr:lantibiotic immunity ABC transporter MutG family permease subunit [Paenibacillus zanthoxyli]